MSDLKKYLKLFNNHDGYEEFTGSTEYIKPNVSRCEEEKHVHYGPTPRPTAITFVETAITVSLDDEQVQLEVNIEPSDVKNKTVYWTTNDRSIATVDGNGLVTLKKKGKFIAMAKSVSDTNMYALCYVNCTNEEPESIELDKYVAYTYQRGETVKINATVLPPEASQKVNWTSSDISIATVDKNGLVTSKGVGECIVTASIDSFGLSASCAVACYGVTGVTLNKESVNMLSGKTTQLIATVTPEAAVNKDVTWASSDSDIATVDSTGLVSSVGLGECEISATSVDGNITSVCIVKVKEDLSDKYFAIVADAPSEVVFSTTGLSNSVDGGENWTTMEANVPVSLQSGDRLLLRGAKPNGSGNFSASTGSFHLEGNIMSLLFNEEFTDKVSLNGKNSAFLSLFKGCSGLTSSSDAILPATTLSNNCYQGMFADCVNLIDSPELPATSVTQQYVYDGMFSGCTSLRTTPDLPATSLGYYCYQNMFKGCTSLKSAPELPAETLSYNTYRYMFSGCTSLIAVPECPVTSITSKSMEGMFYGCTSLPRTMPMKNLTTINGQEAMKNIYGGCTSITDAEPFENLKTVGKNAFYGAYRNCTSLTGVTKLDYETISEYCFYFMFAGCTSLKTVPQDMLPYSAVTENCCTEMFYNCSGLTNAPDLPATKIAATCYQKMFYGCTSLTSIPTILPATTLYNNCYKGMFQNCTSIERGPDLPAPNWPSDSYTNCYEDMFNGCSNMKYLKCLVSSLPSDFSQKHNPNWLCGVSDTGTFVKKPGVTVTQGSNCYRELPQHWTVIDAT